MSTVMTTPAHRLRELSRHTTRKCILRMLNPEEHEMTDPKKCAHSACSCIAPDHHKYCSQTCQDAKSLTELVCQCDHPACSSEALKA
jgi:hypothetical protein